MNAFFEFLIGQLKELVGCSIVFANEQGVRYWLGRDVKLLQPGFYWRVPYLHAIRRTVVAYQQIDLPTQTVLSQDRQPVTFSANVGYHITNARWYQVRVADFDQAMSRFAMGLFAMKIGATSFDDLVQQTAQLQRQMKRSLAGQVADWGVVIDDVRLAELVDAVTVRLYNTI